MDKQAIRERVWDALDESGEARFPFPPHGRIPNFAGADDAAERLAARPEWRAASAIKANPDAPQRPVRERALRAGKTLYVAVPRLRDAACFLCLDPATVDDPGRAVTLSGIDEYAEAVTPDAVAAVDLIVCGSVAVTEAGTRIGKGEGYSDLEYALLAELGAADGETTVATTVHETQVIDDAPDPDPWDVPLDLVVTPGRVVETGSDRPRPDGIRWDLLDDERLAEMPPLAERAPR